MKIYHGGCHGCRSQEYYGAGRCQGCQYRNAIWQLPNLFTKYQPELTREKIMREFKVEVPEGHEIDKDNSTFEKIVFKKAKTLPAFPFWGWIGIWSRDGNYSDGQGLCHILSETSCDYHLDKNSSTMKWGASSKKSFKRVATHAEIKAHLSLMAANKGLVSGCDFVSVGCMHKKVLGSGVDGFDSSDGDYTYKDDSLYADQLCLNGWAVYKEGKWAEVIEAPSLFVPETVGIHGGDCPALIFNDGLHELYWDEDELSWDTICGKFENGNDGESYLITPDAPEVGDMVFSGTDQEIDDPSNYGFYLGFGRSVAVNHQCLGFDLESDFDLRKVERV